MAVLARVDGIEASWLASGLDDAFALVAGRFFRREVRVRARACVAGMLSGLERKTGWGVFLAYAGPKGRALVDRELYLPRSWTRDEVRLAAAKVPSETPFRTKPQLLRLMIERAVAAGIPFGWVTADEAYGDNGPLRAFLEEQQASYVLAVSCDHVITTPAGRRRADALADKLPKRAWQRISCGDGAKGHRWYDWALVAMSRPEISLLIHQHASRPSELAFYLCHTPRAVPAHPACQGRRDPLSRGGVLPGRQERGRPGSLPGAAL
jgi:hypothetical protein